LLWIRDFCPARAEKKKKTKPPTEAQQNHVFSEGSNGYPSIKVTDGERDKRENMSFISKSNRFEEGTFLKVVPVKKK